MTLCPVCETAVSKDTDLCPECGWDIDLSTGELIIGDPQELQQEMLRTQRRIRYYRRFYQQVKRIEHLEIRVTELEQLVSEQRRVPAEKIDDIEELDDIEVIEDDDNIEEFDNVEVIEVIEEDGGIEELEDVDFDVVNNQER